MSSIMAVGLFVCVVYGIEVIGGNEYSDRESRASFKTGYLTEDDVDNSSYETPSTETATFSLKNAERGGTLPRRKLQVGREALEESDSSDSEKTLPAGKNGRDGDAKTPVLRDRQCRVCGVKFRYYSHYDEHFKTDHPNEKPYACPCCPYEGGKRENFLCHVKMKHPGERVLSRISEPNQTIQCEICRTDHRGVKEFENHNIVWHKGSKLIKCGLCDARFIWFASLTAHETKKHGMHDAEFRCKYCERNFFRTDVLETHVGACPKNKTKLGGANTGQDKKKEIRPGGGFLRESSMEERVEDPTVEFFKALGRKVAKLPTLAKLRIEQECWNLVADAEWDQIWGKNHFASSTTKPIR